MSHTLESREGNIQFTTLEGVQNKAKEVLRQNEEKMGDYFDSFDPAYAGEQRRIFNQLRKFVVDTGLLSQEEVNQISRARGLASGYKAVVI